MISVIIVSHSMFVFSALNILCALLIRPSNISYYGVLRRVPCAMWWVLVGDFIKSGVYM